ncbi:MAG: transcriptional repressor LexA [Pyrinomonadaceae bacterium]
MQPRTKRQREVFEYVNSFIEERGYEPSYQQIARHFRIASKSAIAKHIAALERQGLILRVRDSGGSFGLQIRPKNSVEKSVCEIEWLDVPQDGNFKDEWEENSLFIPRFLIGFHQPEKICAFRVRNDSMIEESICEGDIALVEKRAFARDGDCVVALIEKERVVLKQFYRDGANIELRPANKNYGVIRLSAEKVQVKGVFRALLRPLD